MSKRKPQLAEDAILDKVQFPCIFQPKIDGVRALNHEGTLVGRSLDPFKGFGVTEFFSRRELIGFDGEMTLGPVPNSTERLCALTSGALGKFKGVTEMADFHWWVFDLVTDFTADMTYASRYELLQRSLEALPAELAARVHQFPRSVHVGSRDLLENLISEAYDQNYEGGIIRNPRSIHKPGRSTLEGQLWRVKAWMDSEMLCTGFTEGEKNTNEAKTNTLGRTERSSAKAGMVPNGMVGSIQGTLLQDIFHPFNGKLLFPKGLLVSIGTGEMTEKEAADYFKHPENLVGHIIKFFHLAHGVKSLPRMGQYHSHRLPQDM